MIRTSDGKINYEMRGECPDPEPASARQPGGARTRRRAQPSVWSG